MNDSTLDKVRAIISEQLDIAIDEIKSESSFQDDLEADSLDVVEIVMAIEDAFEIEIADEDAESMKTVKDAVVYIDANA